MVCANCQPTPACPMCGQSMMAPIHHAPSPIHQSHAAKPKRLGVVSAYNKRFGSALKSIRRSHLLKSGKWRKGWNAKKAMKAAHKKAKR